MCKETRINATNELQFDSDAILYPQECALDSSTFGVTSSSASGKKIEDGAVLPFGNTPHSDNNNTMSQQEDDEDPHDTMITFLTGRTKSERSSKERAIIFPVKLMYVLQCGKYSHIVNWQVDSDHDEHHFIVQDIDEFTKHVLPSFFKVAKYESFQRKLYRWGFIKTRRTRAEKMKSPKSVSYVHPCFRQGDYNGAAQMTCSGASVEIFKTTQKHRKRQQKQNGNKSSSKKQRISENNNDLGQNNVQQIVTMQQQPVVPSMQSNLTPLNLSSFPQNNNMFMMMNHSSSNDPIASNFLHTMPTFPNTGIFNSNERIQDDSFAGAVIPNYSSTSNSNCGRSDDNKTMISKMSNSSSATRPEEDIQQLLARARTQRELKRIQMNNLMREKMLEELLQTDPSDWTGPDVNTVSIESSMDTLSNNSNIMLMNTAADDDSGNISNNSAASQFMMTMNSGNNNSMTRMDSNMHYTSFDNDTRNMHQQVITDAFNALMRSS
ncbi:hypothetical protein CTEN210_01122 [Chaetoceros tenuissimus]|uniref:HSF-type DNA-binding domain-containing protein n=1 Tax=Chaetoceros tenuissimus TaxID=426638 RepID=A0AAD3CF15_9STRA|nr:hypothetical protein CTEN210_01122 [Chaetoceros tenuissimus]